MLIICSCLEYVNTYFAEVGEIFCFLIYTKYVICPAKYIKFVISEA